MFKQIKQKQNTVLEKMTFTRAVSILLVIVIVVGLVSIALFNSLQPRDVSSLPILRDYQPEFTYTQDGVPPAEDNPELDSLVPINLNEKQGSVYDSMPYISDAFIVRYVPQANQFNVFLDPSYQASPEDVYKWLDSFADVEDARSLNITFDYGYLDTENASK